MKLKLAALLVGILAAATGSAQAQNLAYGAGLKERIEIPAPIPEHGAIAVPAGVPIPEGFTYYLRADLGWAFAGDRSYSNNAVFGDGTTPFISTGGPFAFGSSPEFPSPGVAGDDIFIGTIGAGAYITRHIRTDFTLDFRGKQGFTADGDYSYTSTAAPNNQVIGEFRDNLKINSVVGLANLYFDLLPRGAFTPYVGAGIGFVYNDVSRSYFNEENEVDGTGLIVTPGGVIAGASKERGVALAAALMAGASFAVSHSWMVDVNYRALYLGGMDITTPLLTTPASSSRASIGDTWEHQVRIGLRFNIW